MREAMKQAKGKLRTAGLYRLVVGLLAFVACLYVAWYAGTERKDSIKSRLSATRACAPELRPVLCAHRIVGDEVEELTGQPVTAMKKLFEMGIYCFDADVVRLADDSLYVAHPLMFKPIIEHKTQQPLQLIKGESPTHAALIGAQKLIHDDVVQAEANMAVDEVRPVPLKTVLNTFASLLAAYTDQLPIADMGIKPRSTPRLFLEPKRNTYQSDSLAEIWHLVSAAELQEYVAVWAMDAAHFDVLASATGGAANVAWSYMDQEFSDQVSTVPFPAPVPPEILADSPVRVFGIAKRSPVRQQTAKLGLASETLITLWLMDTHEEYQEACREAADIVITNRPLELQASISADGIQA